MIKTSGAVGVTGCLILLVGFVINLFWYFLAALVITAGVLTALEHFGVLALLTNR